MIEVPSAGFALGEFAAEADFFSLGTNDLLQYFFAVDRDNTRVATISSAFQPGFLRFLRHIVEEAHRDGRPVGLCGELAEKAEALPALLGLGLDSLSMAGARIAGIKSELAALDFARCRGGLEELLGHGDRAAVEDGIGGTSAGHCLAGRCLRWI